MPELPEVETIVRELRDSALIGVGIKQAHVYWPRSIAEPNPDDFCNTIKNQIILSIDRRGKYIVFTLSESTLLVHLRMTGKFLFTKDVTEVHPHERVRLTLSDGRILSYEDQRKFGKWSLLENPEKVFEKLGLEPLSADFTLKNFEKMIHKYDRRVKPFLLDQRHVTGLGNIYVDEALWEAKIHPLRQLSTLSKAEIRSLHAAIINVLKKGVLNTGTSLGAKRANFYSVSGRRGDNQAQLNVFRRDGLHCPRCNSIIQKIVVAQRGTHICPNCQSLYPTNSEPTAQNLGI